MSGIFISYRREDSTAYARLLSDTLADHFGSHLVFRDVDTMGPGVDFPTAIAEAVDECDVLLALIGERWLTAELGGHRRLDDEHDYVRVEIQAALDRGILVVPILLEGTRMPARAELPEALAKLANRNAHRLTDESWSYGVDRLVTALRKVVAPPPPPPPPPSPVDTPPAATTDAGDGEAAAPEATVPLEPSHDAPPPPPAPRPVADAPPAPPPVEAPATDRRRKVSILAVVGVVVLLGVIGLAVGLSGGGGGGGDGGGTDDTTEVSTDSTEVTEQPAAEVETALDASPAVVTAGESVRVSGEGFQPGEKVRVTSNREDVDETVADAYGRFSETFPIDEGVEAGTYDLRAEGMESGRSAEASVEVA